MKDKTKKSLFANIEEPVIIENVEEPIDEVEETIVEEREGIVVNCTSLYIRQAGHVNATPLDTVSVNDILKVYETEGDFYRVITSDGIEGYAMQKYVKIR